MLLLYEVMAICDCEDHASFILECFIEVKLELVLLGLTRDWCFVNYVDSGADIAC